MRYSKMCYRMRDTLRRGRFCHAALNDSTWHDTARDLLRSAAEHERNPFAAKPAMFTTFHHSENVRLRDEVRRLRLSVETLRAQRDEVQPTGEVARLLSLLARHHRYGEPCAICDEVLAVDPELRAWRSRAGDAP